MLSQPRGEKPGWDRPEVIVAYDLAVENDWRELLARDGSELGAAFRNRTDDLCVTT